jgi:hypothetical protein
MEASPREMLLHAARRCGWSLPDDATIEQIEAFALEQLGRVKGAQDRAHGEAGVRSAIQAAHRGDAAYVDAGFWVVAKVLELQAWDDDVARIEEPLRDSVLSR